MKLLLGKPILCTHRMPRHMPAKRPSNDAVQLGVTRAQSLRCLFGKAPSAMPSATKARTLDETYLRHEARDVRSALARAPTAKVGLKRAYPAAPNWLSTSNCVVGASTYIARAQLLRAREIHSLLRVLTPRQFAFIRSNVFVPPQLRALHARLAGRKALLAGHAPLRFAVTALVRGGRLDKLAYLFPYFHLLAESYQTIRGGTWYAVADARDARVLARLADALHTGPEPLALVPAPPAELVPYRPSLPHRTQPAA